MLKLEGAGEMQLFERCPCSQTAAFPLTPALSLGERENGFQRWDWLTGWWMTRNGRSCSLSLRERVRVRGNGLSIRIVTA
jgi:hypothetical protein